MRSEGRPPSPPSPPPPPQRQGPTIRLMHRWSAAAVVDMAASPLGHLIYFAITSCAGWGLLAVLPVRGPNQRPRGVDMFFTAVSAATVSSMSAVEMEVFSDGQLLVLTLLMLLGGEVFLSFVGLLFKPMISTNGGSSDHPSDPRNNGGYQQVPPGPDDPIVLGDREDPARRRGGAVRSLTWIVLTILLVAHAVGIAGVAAYVVYLAPGARWTLRHKSLGVGIFALFTTVSTFANCGFVPTNENVMVFSRDPLLQVLLAALALAGNTMFPPLLAVCCRCCTRRRIVITRETTGYDHLLPPLRCKMLAATVLVFIALQVVLLCWMEWGGALQGLTTLEKLVNAFFLAVNSRHTGESTLDLSALAPAVVVLFVLMMYLPSYTTWFPFPENSTEPPQQGITWVDRSIYLSQLSWLAIAVIAICFTERRKLREDPLNFNVLSIIVEVVSAYGNVGFSMGYSCSRQINPKNLCIHRWTGFVGRWSDTGKFILIFVMFFGRLKKFSMKGGKAWKLS